jgi:hypothetical protein
MNRSSATAPARMRPTRRFAFLIALATATISLTAFAQRPELIPNQVKYADTGIPHATGRSGSATIQARALLGKDGLTSVEVSTGALEDRSTATGNINKIQLRISQGDPANAVIIANHLQEGGWTSVGVPDLRRHQPMEIQATVSGIDGNRTDVVSANEIVKLRPDLTVNSIDVPATAPVNMPVSIDAVISEINHDVGLRADCFLQIDGAVVDYAERIWVDAGDSVTCSFSTVFNSIGTKQIEVYVQSRDVGEYDFDNNRASASITIEPVYGYTATAVQETEESEYNGTFESSWSSGRDYIHNTITRTNNKFDAYLPYEMNLDALRIHYTESYDGQAPVVDRFLVPGGGWNWPRENCGVADQRYLIGIACSGDGLTQITVTRGATRAVYLSEHWERYYISDTEYRDMHYLIRMPQTSGQTFNFNDTVTLHVSADDGATVYDVSPVIQLEAYETLYTTTSGCRDTSWGSHECGEGYRRISGKRGKTTGQ